MRRIQLSPLAVWLISIVCSGLTLGVLLGLIMLAPPRHPLRYKTDLNGGKRWLATDLPSKNQAGLIRDQMGLSFGQVSTKALELRCL